MTSRGQLAGVLSLYCVSALWWLWPLSSVLTGNVAHVENSGHLLGADIDLMLWVLSWGAHALVTNPVEIFSANSFYPAPLSLAYSEHLFGHLPLFAPIYWLTGNPVLAANVLIFASYVLCAFGMYLFARRFVGAPAAFVAGFFFAFHPWRLHLLEHFYILSIQWIPLGLYFAERLLEAGRRRDAAALFGCLALQLLSSFYLAYVLTFVLAVYLPIALWRWWEHLESRRVWMLLAAMGAAAVPFVVTSVPYLLLRELGFLPSHQSGDSLDHGAILTLSPYFAAVQAREVLLGLGMGPVAYGLALVGLLPFWRGYGGVRVMGGLLVVVGVVLAHGPEAVIAGYRVPTPFPFLQSWLPGFEVVRVPARMAQIAILGAGVLVAFGFEPLARRLPGWAAGVAAALVILVGVLSFGPTEFVVRERATGPQVAPAYAWLAANGKGRPLLELPRPTNANAARRMYLSTFHWLPIIGGYSAYPSDFSRHVYRTSAGLPAASALERLTDVLDVGWILVHLDELRGDPTRWETLPPGLEKVAEFDRDLLLRVDRRPSEEALAALVRSEASLSGVPRETLSHCAGEFRIADAPEPPWPAGERLRLRVGVKNTGTTAWPALALNPKHLVRLFACMAEEAQPLCLGRTIPLSRDLRPGEELTLPVWVNVPTAPGAARLELSLVQLGDGPLGDCGFPSRTEIVEVAERS